VIKLKKGGKMMGLLEALRRLNENINARNGRGQTLLMYACLNGHIKVAKMLIERGADVNAKDNNGQTVLLYAVASKSPEMVKLLLDNGAIKTINDKDNKGLNPLLFAIGDNNLEIVKLLLDYGAELLPYKNISILQFALYCAIHFRDYKIYRFLKQYQKAQQ
jgi:ankyrin repeat protein